MIEDNPLSGAHSAGGARGESEQGGEETKSLDPTYDGGLHHSAYVLFVAVGVFGGAGLARSDVGLLVIGLLLGGLGAVCLAVAAIKQTQSRVAGMLSGVTWVAMGIALVVFLCYQGVKMAVVLRDTGPSGRVWQPLLAVFEDATEGLTPAFALLAFASVAAFIVGGVGLIAVRDHRRRIRSEGVAPPPIPARAGPEPAED